MKKLLFFILISTFCSAQTQKDVEQMAKNYFEKKYIPQFFKDPYSYEFKNISSAPTTRGELMTSAISVEKSMSETRGVGKKRKAYVEKMNELIAELNSLSESEKNEVAEYSVLLDSYAANSYGNKVLGSYIIVISADGKNIKKVYSR